MSPELIGISAAAVLVVAILCWLLLPRSKSAAPATILLETRIPGAKATKPPQAVPVRSAMKQTPAKESAPTAAPKKSSVAGQQKHHASPRKPSAGKPPVADQRQAPVAKKSPPKPAIDPKLTGQISDLDNRLDAIEELVTSIEASLAEFDALDRADMARDPAQAA